MDLSLFLLGTLGALLFVYLAKQEVIPEFRPLFDTTRMLPRYLEYQDRIKSKADYIDTTQETLRKEGLSPAFARQLEVALQSAEADYQSDTKNLQMLEAQIKQSQLISRLVGFLFYLILGGVFGAMLAGRVKIDGMSGDLPNYIQAFVIGSTWTAYLSILGIRLSQDQIQTQFEARKKTAQANLEILKQDLVSKVEDQVKKAETSDKVEQPVMAAETAKMVIERIDQTKVAAEKNWDVTQQMVKRQCKGLL